MAACDKCGAEAHRIHQSKDGLQRCPDCHKERSRELSRERNKVFRQRSPEKRRAQLYRHKYGIDYDDYLRLLEDQDGVCAICRLPESTRSKSEGERALAVDHDHITGAVRGLLCHFCNSALGAMSEDVHALLAMIEYILAR